MRGYLSNEDDEVEQDKIVVIDGIRYYKTGDKGNLDEDGFLTITDRFSRFAKIGGEMISLGAVEREIKELFSEDLELIVTSINDEKRGEKIVLLYSAELPEDEIKSIISKSKILPIMRPRAIYKVDEIPKLASGKSDFKKAKKVAQEMTKYTE